MGPLVEVEHGKLCVESGDGTHEGLINSPCLPGDENGKDKSTTHFSSDAVSPLPFPTNSNLLLCVPSIVASLQTRCD